MCVPNPENKTEFQETTNLPAVKAMNTADHGPVKHIRSRFGLYRFGHYPHRCWTRSPSLRTRSTSSPHCKSWVNRLTEIRPVSIANGGVVMGTLLVRTFMPTFEGARGEGVGRGGLASSAPHHQEDERASSPRDSNTGTKQCAMVLDRWSP